MDEPSLLDYLKEKISVRNLLGKRKTTPEIPEIPFPVDSPIKSEESIRSHMKFAVLPGIVLFLALFAQFSLEPPRRSYILAIALYVCAAALMVLSLSRGEWEFSKIKDQAAGDDGFRIKKWLAVLILPFLVLSFFAFSGNKFTSSNIFSWIVVLIVALAAFWQPSGTNLWTGLREKISRFVKNPEIRLRINWWELLLIAAFLLSAWFRLSDLNQIPNEMISDHAEKLMDVNDVINGESPIFFYRNTGREPFQFYLTALIVRLFGNEVSFLNLKLGTALMGLVTLIYVFRLGKELGNRWVGLLAVILMGIAYWPNVIARIGLRFALYPLFVAPMLFYLFRGLRRMNTNDFILAGISLGLGLHGYSPFRITPFLVGAVVLLFILHERTSKQRSNALLGFLLIALFSLVIFLPLVRFWTENPDMFGYRALSRLGSSERPLPGPVLQIFLTNFWNASIMPFWNNGNVWAHSIPFRPALDVISAALYFLGVVALLFRYLRQRRWQDVALLISIPFLLLPSILSLAFPEENPALNRTSGAAVPVFLICAIALEGFLRGLWQRVRTSVGKAGVVTVALLLIFLSAVQNHDLVFRQYAELYKRSSWNTSQIGAVIRDFIDSEGSLDGVWVVGVSHWVDTRAVGINSGYPAKDYAIWPEDFAVTLTVPGPKLFILRADDQADLDQLKSLYPRGYLILHQSTEEGKSFYSFVVPPEN